MIDLGFVAVAQLDTNLRLSDTRLSGPGSQYPQELQQFGPSALTLEDSNYWDVLHYRVGIASLPAHAIGAAALRRRNPPTTPTIFCLPDA